MKKIFVTGVCGFIASKTAEMLLKEGHSVLGVDNLNEYYDVKLKHYRLKSLCKYPRFKFVKMDVENFKAVEKLFKKFRPNSVAHLAARAGVRYSLENPFVYGMTNVMGTLNLLESCRRFKVKQFVMASTSSLYAGQKSPFKETLAVNEPISPYAATKKGAEALCYSYHYLFGINVTVLRYFTVYGPAGRPDMSLFRFIKWIDEGKPLELFGDGSQTRDFTYVDDIAAGTVKALRLKGFHTINLGGKRPHSLKKLIRLVEGHLGKSAKIKMLPFHKADLMETCADATQAEKLLKWKARVGLEEGVERTVRWYVDNRRWLRSVKV